MTREWDRTAIAKRLLAETLAVVVGTIFFFGLAATVGLPGRPETPQAKSVEKTWWPIDAASQPSRNPIQDSFFEGPRRATSLRGGFDIRRRPPSRPSPDWHRWRGEDGRTR